AAIHAGKLTNEGGKVIVEKKPGQNSYEEITKNGIKSTKYGSWSGSFVFPSSSVIPPDTRPPETPPKTPAVTSQCSSAAKQLTQVVTEVICPAGCHTEPWTVWGTDIYRDDSSICQAAIHAGMLTKSGGRVIVEKKPGQSSYGESRKNGIKTSPYGADSISFVVRLPPTLPPTSPPAPTYSLPAVPAPCSMAANQLAETITEVTCPVGCLNEKGNVWGSDVYTDDSSICRAAIHAGRLTNEGGKVIVEKTPGQSSYEEITKNGIKSTKYGAWSRSFVFPSSSVTPPDTRPPETPSKTPAVTSQCSSAAKQLTQVVTEVICPAGCHTEPWTVWGTDIYRDDSSICQAAIHAGMLTKSGGRVIVEKKPGQSSYGESRKNGIKTSPYGADSISFVVRLPPTLPPTSPPAPTYSLPAGN
ncbi:hypothetical protein FKM82_024190, partial [Ascaphus truei]